MRIKPLVALLFWIWEFDDVRCTHSIPRKVLPFFRKLSTGMNRSIWIRPGITENSIQMVSAPGVFSIYKTISIGNSGNFRLGRERSICHKSHSFTSPSPSLHQKTRCLGKLFCYFLERVFVRRFPVKQMVIIVMCGYEKSDICMFPSF